jgi:hypothetical protein
MILYGGKLEAIYYRQGNHPYGKFQPISLQREDGKLYGFNYIKKQFTHLESYKGRLTHLIIFF